jgi:hypothetical protein
VNRVPGTRPEHLTRDPELLIPNITELELATIGPADGHLTHDKWVVDGVEAKPQYGRPHLVTVFSPCCGRQRQRIQHGYAFSCPGCGWWWRYHGLGWTTRLVSLGKEKPR